jgi:TonB family protein
MRLPLLLLLLLLPAAAIAGDAVNDQSAVSESDGYLSVSPADLEIRKQASPDFPKKAIREGYTHEECVAQLFVSDAGKVEDVQVQMGCPELFHRSVQKAARKWRFEPYSVDGAEPVPVTFALRFRFHRET